MIKNTALLLALFLPISVYSQDCRFQGKVFPQNKTQEVSEIYTTACKWFTTKFDVELDPNIILESISSYNSEEAAHQAESSLAPKMPDIMKGLLGLFSHPFTKGINNIYINEDNYFFKKEETAQKSVIFHEIIHYLIKAGNWSEDNEKLKGMHQNIAVHEGFVFFAQNEYIKMASKGEKSLADYIIFEETESIETIKRFRDFPRAAELIMFTNYNDYLLNAIDFFSENTREKYRTLVEGRYYSQVVQMPEE